MNYTLNGKQEKLPDNCRLIDIIKNRNLNIDSIVIEYNEIILKKDDINEIVIKENDKIEILGFMGGG